MKDNASDTVAGQQDLGDVLIASGKLDARGLERARRVAESRRETLPRVLATLGLVTESDIAAALADALKIPRLVREHIPLEPVPLPNVSTRFLRQKRLLPILDGDGSLVLAMADPLDRYAFEAFCLASASTPPVCVAEPRLIEKAIEALYGDGSAAEGPANVSGMEFAEDLDVERLRDLASEAPVVQLVNSLINTAVEIRASDVHIEPYENEFRVRYRVDGVLQDGMPLDDRLRAAVVSRIKIMARLDIAERRLPQDGRVKTVVRGKSIDLRVSTMPIVHGESVVIRILDRDSVALDFESLGIVDPARQLLSNVVAEPDGIFLVTGPTGSGKTTTLYAALSTINSPEKKVLTVEDPIEYQLDGVNQVQVRPSIGLTFAHVLRSMLRQDPDVILVGEIRDSETARIATQAALTGHMVLSTLHTNDAATAITRLLDMGIENYLLTSTLNGVAAQRLVRRLCLDCREPYRPADEVVEEFGLARLASRDDVVLHKARGCANCNGRGYAGRTVIMEALRLDADLRTLVLRNAEAKEIQRAAVASGMQTIFEDGLRRAIEGVTTLEEVLRTTRTA